MSQIRRRQLLQEIQTRLEELLVKQKNTQWSIIARPEQMLPQNNWRTWLILAGRGFGKTRTGSEAVLELVKQGYRRICLLGATLQEVRRVMLEGESGLLTVSGKVDLKYYPSRGVIVWPNGAQAFIFTAENPKAMRGPQFDCAWVDEFMKFDNINEVWDQLMMTLRLGNPKLIITTTPRSVPILKKLIDSESVVVTRGTKLDNSRNLSSTFIQSILEQYDKTPFARQEIYGEILNDDIPLWSRAWLQYADEIPKLDQVVIGIDPAVSNNINSDETGIIVCGKSGTKIYVLKDASMKSSPIEWITRVRELYYQYAAKTIVVEVNQGGDIIKSLILKVDPKLKVNEVRASKSKYVRAQSISILYMQNLVYHVNNLFDLEYQMLNFEHLPNSPDRVDALVWAIQYLSQPNCKAYVI